MMNEQYIDLTIEALVLASPEPLATSRIAALIDEVTPSQVARSVARLNGRYSQSGASFRIREIAGGYQFYIMSEYVGYVTEMFSRRRKLRLTRAALETLAITAYRQPVTRTEIEHIRGVASDGVMKTLLEKNLITVTGRAETIGKPLQYGSTDEFLKFFGLAKLDDLPKMSEIEQMLSAAESKSQTELQLQTDADGQPVKLNIADGTYDPERREELIEAAGGLDSLVEETETEAEGEKEALVRETQETDLSAEDNPDRSEPITSSTVGSTSDK